MYNPIVFRRLNKSWKADEFIPYLNKTYKELEAFLNTSFHYPMDMIRIFATIEQQNDWMARASEVGFDYYLTSEKTAILSENNINHPNGYGVLKQSGWVDLVELLNKYRQYLLTNNLLIETLFEQEKLVKHEAGYTYENIASKHIIFAEGNSVRKNALFNHYPFSKAKGELLTVKVEGLNTDKVLNKGFFILPIAKDTFRIGATYNWSDETTLPTETGKQELIDKIKTVIDGPFEILDHKAGIRPTTKDRRPIIGRHPEHKNLSVFNGLGTKGVMIAPYFVNHFIDYLEGNIELDKEVDLRRFEK